MARYSSAGAETRDTTNIGLEGSAGAGSYSIDTSTFRSGSASFKFDSLVAGNAVDMIVPQVVSATGTVFYWRLYVNFSQFPSSTSTIIIPNGETAVRVRVTSGGLLQLWNASAQVGSSSSALSTGTWYRVELSLDSTAASGSRVSELRLDGTTVAQMTNGTFGSTSSMRCGWVDAPGASKVFFIDDISCNDTSGSTNTSWPGDGKIALLVPISDNARATLWTGGAGGTTNLFDAVNNTPPIGTASETNLTQIEHAGGAAGTTDAYDANMTTYSTAGITANDTINFIYIVVAHGEDVATGSKLLSYECLSNPVIASTGSFSVGNDAGALGTYPSLWTIKTKAVQSPTVTVGTSPVMRIIRPETATRVASVCSIFMIVDYTPGSGARIPRHGFVNHQNPGVF